MRTVNYTFNLYALGRIVCMLASHVRHPKAEHIVEWLERWYAPFLELIRNIVKPLTHGKLRVDLSPLILRAAIILIREGPVTVNQSFLKPRPLYCGLGLLAIQSIREP